MFAGSEQLLSGASPYVGGGLVGLIGLAAIWLFRISNRVLERGDQRDERNWDQLQSENTRKDVEIQDLRRQRDAAEARSNEYLAQLRACWESKGVLGGT